MIKLSSKLKCVTNNCQQGCDVPKFNVVCIFFVDRRDKYQPKGDEALRLRSKDTYSTRVGDRYNGVMPTVSLLRVSEMSFCPISRKKEH